MITRIWKGWTTPDNADAYEGLIRSTIFPGIMARQIEGFRKVELYRGAPEAEVEFVTVMWFESWEAVKSFAGPDWKTSVVPPAARAVLARFDAAAQHYEVRAGGVSTQGSPVDP